MEFYEIDLFGVKASEKSNNTILCTCVVSKQSLQEKYLISERTFCTYFTIDRLTFSCLITKTCLCNIQRFLAVKK